MKGFKIAKILFEEFLEFENRLNLQQRARNKFIINLV